MENPSSFDSAELEAQLALHLDAGTPCRILLRSDILADAGDTLRQFLPAGRWLLVADGTTWSLAGEPLEASLARQHLDPEHVIQQPALGGAKLVAGDAEIDALTLRVRQSTCPVSALVAIGAGTVNDIVKLTAWLCRLPYAVVATAPSMNGYTSGIAAIMSGGIKQSVPCGPPVACLADLSLMTGAPGDMIAAGYGDLVSRSVSTADWYLSHALVGTDFDPELLELVDASGRLVEGIAKRLPERQAEAISRLTAALCLSGLTMRSSSAPVSGAEHLISHYLDMTGPPHGEPADDLHGRQVGIATLVTSTLYERLAAIDPADVSPIQMRRRVPAWSEVEAALREHFGELADSILCHARQFHPSEAELDRRLEVLRRDWESIWSVLHKRLRPPGDIRQELLDAGCPIRFADIGITPARARAAVQFSRYVRPRYTILHLCGELGLLDDLSAQVVNELEGHRHLV